MKKLKETKIGKIIFRNFPLKILAMVIAVIIWIVVVNIEDPYTTNPISGIGITVYGTEALDEMGYAYQLESNLALTIRVRAPQTVMDKLKATDFKAKVDVSQRTEADTCKVEVEYVGDYRDRVEILGKSEEYIKINIDNKISKEIEIQIQNKGEPQNGFVIGGQTVSPSTITVIGAETIINKIASVGVSYDINAMNQSITETVPLHFYDANGKEISAAELARLESNRNTVRLDVTIYPTKWVEVNYALSGELPENYTLGSYSGNPTSVLLAGTKEDLAKITSIDVPADGLNITGLKQDTTLNIPLMNYLTSNYSIVSDVKVLSVDIKLLHYVEKEIEIPFSAIEMNGLNTAYKVRITSGTGLHGSTTSGGNSMKVKVYGEESYVKGLKASDISPSVTMTNSTPGTFSMKLSFKDSNDFEIRDSYYVNIVVTDENGERPTNSEEPTEEETTKRDTEPTEDPGTIPEETIGDEAEY